MITIPLYIFLFVYLLYLCIFFVFAIINFYHIIITGSFTFTSFLVSFFVFTLAILTFYFTYDFLLQINWQTKIIILNFEWFNKIF